MRAAMERITKYRVIVVGSGPAGCTAAIYLSRANLAPLVLEGLQSGGQVTVVHRRNELRASKIMQERALGNAKIEFVFDSTVEEVIGTKEGGVTSLKLRNLKTNAMSEMKAQGLFVAIGHTPNTKVYAGQLELDERGYIVLPHRNATVTNIQGVFACGDVVDHVYRQAITAAGTGCMAALDCERWLTHERITERWDLPKGEEERV